MGSSSLITLVVDLFLSYGASWYLILFRLDPWMGALIILVHHSARFCS